MRDRCASVVYELDAPSSVVLDPDEYDACTVAGGELLIRLVPLYEYHLQRKKSGTYNFVIIFSSPYNNAAFFLILI